MSDNGSSGDKKYHVSVLLAHHNCPKLANSSNPARPVMVLLGRDHVAQRNYYSCPACDTEIMLQVTINEKE